MSKEQQPDLVLIGSPTTGTRRLARRDRSPRPAGRRLRAHTSTANCILANMATDLGPTLSHDPRKRIVTGDDEAKEHLLREYRRPWPRPAV